MFTVVQLHKHSPNSRCRLSSCFFAACHFFGNFFGLVPTLETSEMSAIFVFTTKTTQPRPKVVSVNGALTCKEAALLTSAFD